MEYRCEATLRRAPGRSTTSMSIMRNIRITEAVGNYAVNDFEQVTVEKIGEEFDEIYISKEDWYSQRPVPQHTEDMVFAVVGDTKKDNG